MVKEIDGEGVVQGVLISRMRTLFSRLAVFAFVSQLKMAESAKL